MNTRSITKNICIHQCDDLKVRIPGIDTIVILSIKYYVIMKCETHLLSEKYIN